MAHANSTAKPTSARLLREMAQLPVGDLDRLACNLLVPRSAKRAQRLPDREADLLLAINRVLSPRARARYRRLCAKRGAGTLRRAEHRELVRLSDETETINAGRAKSLVALAALRKITVPELMESLGLDSLANG